MSVAVWLLTLSLAVSGSPDSRVVADTGKARRPPVVQPARDRAKPKPKPQAKPREPVLKRRKPPGRPD